MTKEYFYVVKVSPDNFNNKCKKCHINTALKGYYKKTNNLKEMFDVQGKSKVPTLKKIKISQQRMKEWKKDNALITTIRCRWCGKVHEIRKLYHNFNCDCKHNLILFYSINFLWSEILFMNKTIEDNCIIKFDPWK